MPDELSAQPTGGWRDLGLTRAEKWHYVISSVIGGYRDEGVAIWLAHFKGDLDAMMDEAWKLRGGMIAS